MTNFRDVSKWDVWLISLHFIDNPEKSKVRPVLVLAVETSTVVVAKITSHVPRDMIGELELSGWRDAGLLKQSTLRCSQVFQLSKEEFNNGRFLGVLSEKDQIQVESMLLNMGILEPIEES